MKIYSIQTEKDFNQALEKINSLMDVPYGSPEGTLLEHLVGLVESYEAGQDSLAPLLRDAHGAISLMHKWNVSLKDKEWIKSVQRRIQDQVNMDSLIQGYYTNGQFVRRRNQ